MAPKKKIDKVKIEAKKEPVVKVKSVIRATPAAKSIVKKVASTTKEEKTIPYQRVQTAEGWKRMMKKQRMAKK